MSIILTIILIISIFAFDYITFLPFAMNTQFPNFDFRMSIILTIILIISIFAFDYITVLLPFAMNTQFPNFDFRMSIILTIILIISIFQFFTAFGFGCFTVSLRITLHSLLASYF